MQVMGGIGYTNVYPIERLLRDTRLLMIWTGTNEIMNLLIQHEYYNELGRPVARPRRRSRRRRLGASRREGLRVKKQGQLQSCQRDVRRAALSVLPQFPRRRG